MLRYITGNFQLPSVDVPKIDDSGTEKRKLEMRDPSDQTGQGRDVMHHPQA